MSFEKLVKKLSNILDTKPTVTGNRILFIKTRDINIEISGFDKSNDPNVVSAYINFQIGKEYETNTKCIDLNQDTLAIGEFPALKDEVLEYERLFISSGAIVGAVNDWILAEPVLRYVHFENVINDPIKFAKYIAPTWKSL